MAVNSINTNTGAMIALQNLNATNSALNTTQNRINTGLKVSSAKDNGATWAIAQNSRAAISSYDSVKDSINRAASTVDVAISAGETISDLLNQMKAKALAASDTSLDATSRGNLADDFTALRDQIAKTVENASFNGANLLKSGAAALTALANADGSSKLTVATQVMALGATGALSSVSTSATLSTAASALTMVATLTTAIGKVNAGVAKLGTASNALTTHLNFVSKLQDTLTAGVGNLVDADVAKESANLTALQTKQQLGIQALSIANSSSSTLLSLFR
jgi:flagellin